jgi:uncharacterized protein (DUF433 family)
MPDSSTHADTLDARMVALTDVCAILTRLDAESRAAVLLAAAAFFGVRLELDADPSRRFYCRHLSRDLAVCGGDVVLLGTRLPIAAILGRIEAGEDVDEIASDYGHTEETVRDAIGEAGRLLDLIATAHAAELRLVEAGEGER